jgi:hypothetical protein
VDVTISFGVREIGHSSFVYCTSLVSLTIPESVGSIATYGFSDCYSLSRLTIPASVTNIGDSAFLSCQSLAGVYFAGNSPAVGAQVFADAPMAVAFYLPGANGWSNTFAGIPAVMWNPVIQTGDGGFGVRNGQFGFNITGTSNLVVAVQAATNLTSAVWTPLQTFTLTNGLYHFSEPFSPNSPGRYYRLGFP